MVWHKFKDGRLSGLGLTDEETAALDRMSTLVDVPAGTVLCRQGAHGLQLTWIVTGEAEVIRSGEVIAHVGSGDVVGEGTMVGAHSTCSADVVALTPMTIAVLSRHDWQRASYAAPSLVNRLLGIAMTREPALAA
jgi:CRP/FNR family cyclic AMP-dependent transcriptional regulator